MPALRRHLRLSSVRRGRQRGLSLVEMMVGIALGLFIVAGASMLTTTQLSENRRLILETQVQQDLRAAADIITREVRRTGYMDAAQSLQWSPATPTKLPKPNNGVVKLLAGGDVVSYTYDRPGQAAVEFGFRLENGVVRHRLGSATQDLTDKNTLRVTEFTVEQVPVATKTLACPKLCANGTEGCWPTYSVVDLKITLTGQAVSDSSVSRTIKSRTRLRNDAVTFNVSASKVCP